MTMFENKTKIDDFSKMASQRGAFRPHVHGGSSMKFSPKSFFCEINMVCPYFERRSKIFCNLPPLLFR